MKILIKLKNKEEIVEELTPAEYERLKRVLSGEKTKKIEIGDRIIDCSSIMLIEPAGPQETEKDIPRLAGPKFESVGISERMKELFGAMKARGFFQDYSSYEEWAQKKQN